MNAILLAAGVGKRLRPFTDHHPKCLVRIGGRTLLDRHLDALHAVGVDAITIVVGHCQDQIRAAVAGHRHGGLVSLVDNPEYTRGSVLSLYRARDALGQGGAATLVMDADVLYPLPFLQRLADAAGSSFLIDERASETGEEMMIGVKGGLVRTIDRRIGPGWDTMGEGVGFFKVDAADAPALVAELDAAVAQGDLDIEYEGVLLRHLRRHPAGYALVNDLPWTEIDFAEDVTKAEAMAAGIDATYPA